MPLKSQKAKRSAKKEDKVVHQEQSLCTNCDVNVAAKVCFDCFEKGNHSLCQACFIAVHADKAHTNICSIIYN